MVVDTEYYETLGLTPESSDASAIKKAYRKLALKWHPDKNPDNRDEAEKKFKDISVAYDILSDPEKKTAYDNFGKDLSPSGPSQSSRRGSNFHHSPHFTFHSADDIFQSFFGTSNIFDLFDNDPFFRQGSSSRSRGGRMNDPFGGFMSNMGGFGGSGGTSISFSSNMGGFGGSNFSSVSSSTQIINGKRIETTTRNENGVETVEVKENGVLTQKTVNGQQQQITNGSSNSSGTRSIRSGSSRSGRDRGSQNSNQSRPGNRRSNNQNRAHTTQLTMSNNMQPQHHNQQLQQQQQQQQTQPHRQSSHPQNMRSARQAHDSFFNEDDMDLQQSIFNSFSRPQQNHGHQDPFGQDFPFRGGNPFGGGFPFGNTGSMFGNGFPF